MLTKKHFEAIAKIINKNYPTDSRQVNTRITMIALTEDLADYLETTNPDFDRGKFIGKSCKADF